jgi:hypothetical protein
LNAFINQFNTAARWPAVCRLVRDDLKLGDRFQSFDLRLTKTFKFSEHFILRVGGSDSRWSVRHGRAARLSVRCARELLKLFRTGLYC